MQKGVAFEKSVGGFITVPSMSEMNLAILAPYYSVSSLFKYMFFAIRIPVTSCITIIVIILTAGALAFVVLVNLTQVNISERIREIATLKVLGFRQGEVQSYLFKEIFLLSVIGALAGMPLGVVFHRFIMNVISMDMVMFGMVIKARSYLYAFAVTIVFSLIVLLFTIPSLKRIEMIESLKSVE